jgi:hypothetical protein
MWPDDDEDDDGDEQDRETSVPIWENMSGSTTKLKIASTSTYPRGTRMARDWQPALRHPR